MDLEKPPKIISEPDLKIYLEGKSDEELEAIIADPATEKKMAEEQEVFNPVKGFTENELISRARKILESRKA